MRKTPDKITKTEAQYQDTPLGPKRCGTCSMFETPNTCSLVAGKVQRNGYCIHWSKK